MTNEKRTISLGLELSDQTLGSHMGILVPSLKLKITNMGIQAELVVGKPGDSTSRMRIGWRML